MKCISVLRHAKSQRDDTGLADFDRPLDDRGRKAATHIGHVLKRRGFCFDLVLASPAVRVRETIELVDEAFNFAAPIRFEQEMYLADEELLLTFISNLPETVHRPLLVGHNPGLQRVLLEISARDEDRFHDRVRDKFPTAALAVVELVPHWWRDIGPASGRITELIVPDEFGL